MIFGKWKKVEIIVSKLHFAVIAGTFFPSIAITIRRWRINTTGNSIGTIPLNDIDAIILKKDQQHIWKYSKEAMKKCTKSAWKYHELLKKSTQYSAWTGYICSACVWIDDC